MTRVALVTAGGSGMEADAARRLAGDGFAIGVMSHSGKGEALGKELGGLRFTGSNLEPEDLGGFEPRLASPVSNVSRAGLAAYTKLFSDRYGPDNLRMNNVLPGLIDTLPQPGERTATVPLGRTGRAAEVSATISFLASDGAAYITGQNIRVDGGETRSV